MVMPGKVGTFILSMTLLHRFFMLFLNMFMFVCLLTTSEIKQ